MSIKFELDSKPNTKLYALNVSRRDSSSRHKSGKARAASRLQELLHGSVLTWLSDSNRIWSEIVRSESLYVGFFFSGGVQKLYSNFAFYAVATTARDDQLHIVAFEMPFTLCAKCDIVLTSSRDIFCELVMVRPNRVARRFFFFMTIFSFGGEIVLISFFLFLSYIYSFRSY